MAGGRSRRLGGIDKGLLEIKGQALIQYVTTTLYHQTREISIVANRSLSTYRTYAPQVFPDTSRDFAGPLAGLATFAERAHSNWVAIVACDLIFLPDGWVDRLMSVAVSQKKTVVCATDQTSGKHALCALAQRETLSGAQTLLNKDLHRWTDWLNYNRAASVPFDSELLFNINAWEDTVLADRLLSNNAATY